jgi:hypothetical protein
MCHIHIFYYNTANANNLLKYIYHQYVPHYEVMYMHGENHDNMWNEGQIIL